MTLLPQLPSVSALPHSEKLQLLQWLSKQLTKDEGVTPLVSGIEYPVWSPHDAFEPAADLSAFLEWEKVQGS